MLCSNNATIQKNYLNFFRAVWIFFSAGERSASDPRMAIKMGNQKRFNTHITIFKVPPPMLHKPGPARCARTTTADR
jgi:hypothetical protein